MASLPNIFVRKALESLKAADQKIAKNNFPLKRTLFEEACSRLPPQSGIKLKKLEIDGIKAEWATPTKSDNSQVILYVHGGGHAIGSIKSHRNIAIRLAHKAARAVLSFEYRLAPENPYPAGLDDAMMVYQWLLDTDFEPTQIAFCGDSSGGGLLLALLLQLRDSQLPLPACAVCFSPWADLTANSAYLQTHEKRDPFIDPESVRTWAHNYALANDRRHPYISPVFGDYTGLPPIYIQVGTEEILLGDSLLVEKAALAANTPIIVEVWDDMMHVWQSFWQILPEGKQALTKAAQFIQTHTAKIDRFAPKNDTDKAVHFKNLTDRLRFIR
jgi:epsilon-lactone hydrolase